MTAESVAVAARAQGLQPPGPRGIPIIGCLNSLLRNPMNFWSKIAARYGGIARVPLKGKHVYLISDPKLLVELLVTKRTKYRKNTRYKAAIDTFGFGLLLSEADAWKRQRLLSGVAFKPDYISDQVPTMAARSAEFLQAWQEPASRGEIRDVDTDFFALSQFIAGQYLMGSKFRRIEREFGSAAAAIQNNWPLPPRNIVSLLLHRNSNREQRLATAIARIDRCLFAFLDEQRQSDFADCGLLEILAQGSRSQGDEFDDQSLRDQLLSLFFAGHETTATSLSWIHYLLSENPDVRQRMYAEIRDVLGTRLDPTGADVERLVYTEQVINESLRLYSPIHSISRVALEEDTIGGYLIPEGAMIYISLYATQRLASIWPNPDRFDPERFSAENAAAIPRFAFIPFAAGHRNCVGAAMAVAELKTILAQIAQRFVLEHDKSHRVIPEAGTTMHPKFGMRMQLALRH